MSPGTPLYFTSRGLICKQSRGDEYVAGVGSVGVVPIPSQHASVSVVGNWNWFEGAG